MPDLPGPVVPTIGGIMYLSPNELYRVRAAPNLPGRRAAMIEYMASLSGLNAIGRARTLPAWSAPSSILSLSFSLSTHFPTGETTHVRELYRTARVGLDVRLYRRITTIATILIMPVIAFSQAKQLELPLDLAFRNGITPTEPTAIYANPPSTWVSNLFNEQIGTLEDSTSKVFTLEDARLFSSLKGNQLWVFIKPKDEEADDGCYDGCWVLLGVLTDRLWVASSNFDVVQ